MPKAPQYGGGNNTDSTHINYPTGAINTIAQQIQINAKKAISQHDQYCKQIHNYIQTLPVNLQTSFIDLLNKHQQRLYASYQWQLNLADALIKAVQEMESVDQDVAKAFTYQGFGG